MCYPADLCASATSASSPTGVALNSSPCAFSCWQQQQVSRDPPAVLRHCAPCGSVRNVAVPWSYWNGSPRFSCDSVPLPRQSSSNHETIFLNSIFSHPPGRSLEVCPGADSATHPHEFLAVPSHASSISRLQPHLRVAFPLCPSGWVAFKTHNGRGPNPASFKRLYRKRPAETFHLDLEILVTGSLPIQH